MLAPFATLAFLATLWLIALIGVEMLGASGGKIVAALRRQSPLTATPNVHRFVARISLRARPQPILHAQPRLCAAA